MSWMNKHEKLERNSFLLLGFVIVTVLIGGMPLKSFLKANAAAKCGLWG